MSLSRRAFVLIFPVVLAGYTLAASSVYVTQNAAIRRFEQARLDSQVANLGELFRSSLAINRSLISTLLLGDALRLFFGESDDSYRSNAVGLRVQESIRSLWDDPQTFVSFAVLTKGAEPEYYYENSDDPFASIGKAQVSIARRLLAERKASSWDFVNRNGARPLIVHSQWVDPVTMTEPVNDWGAGAKLVQVAVQPERFVQTQRALEREYGAAVEFSSQRMAATDALSAEVELGSSLVAQLTPSKNYFSRAKTTLQLTLAVGVVVMSLLSVGLLMALIRRFITRPVAALDRQLTEVMSGEIEAIAATDEKGEVGRLSSNMKRLHDDVVRSLKQVRDASLTDHLTGISNRLALNERLTKAIQNASSLNTSCAMLFFDLDNFKFVNDRYGHRAGDELLCLLAQRVQQAIANALAQFPGASAHFARLSGDEFAILVETPVPCDAAEHLARDVLALFEGGLSVSGERYPVGASIGIARFPADARNATELMSNADAAMYRSKASGKNTMSSFSAELDAMRRRTSLIQDALRRVDPDLEFSLVYMPIVDSRGDVAACEALLRWSSPDLGAIGPDEFIPIAERNGLFSKIDMWVTERALRDYGQLAEWFGPDFVLSINVSSAQLRMSAMAEHISDCLLRHRVAASRIEIELTETFAAELDEGTRQSVAALRAMGLRVAVDDFGVGYTSIQQIIDYDVDTIKLDRSVVTRLATLRGRSTLRALVGLCHARGMRVVGEGVDTPEKHHLLAEAKCDLFQGFGISAPRALDELGVWRLRAMQRQLRERRQEPSAHGTRIATTTPQ